MRYLRIFLLNCQEILEARSRMFVWFLLGCVSPLILILFWRGANPIEGWTFSQIASYYLLVIILNSFLMSHHEDTVARIDIQEGGLTAYLLKPFSYIKLKFFHELSYRLLQGFSAVVLLILFIIFFPSLFVFTNSSVIFSLSIILTIGAFFLGFLFKTIVGLMAFWFTDARGAFETGEVLLFIFAGYLMPIAFFPHWLEQVSTYLPFAYMLYFPIIAFEGKLTEIQLLQVLVTQSVWIGVLFLLYKKMWAAGVKKYTAVGQ